MFFEMDRNLTKILTGKQILAVGYALDGRVLIITLTNGTTLHVVAHNNQVKGVFHDSTERGQREKER